MKNIVIVIFIIIMLVSCSSKAIEPKAEPNIKGVVQEINTIGTAILVDSTSDGVNGLVWVSMRDQPEFEQGISNDILVGNYVEIVVDGDIAESYPMQATARKILVNK